MRDGGPIAKPKPKPVVAHTPLRAGTRAHKKQKLDIVKEEKKQEETQGTADKQALTRIDGLLSNLFNRTLPAPSPFAVFTPLSPQITELLKSRFLDAPQLDVQLVKGQQLPANGPTWHETVEEMRAAELQQREIKAGFDARGKLEVKAIAAGDPRGMEGELGLFVREGCELKQYELIGFYQGLLGYEYQTHCGLAQDFEFNAYSTTPLSRSPEGRLFVISSPGAHGNFTKRANDYRINPVQRPDSEQDAKLINAHWGELLINGAVPLPFFYARKRIGPGEQVLVDYGRAYWDAAADRSAEHERVLLLQAQLRAEIAGLLPTERISVE